MDPQAVDPNQLDSGTLLGAIAIIVSLVLSVGGFIRTWRSDARTARKEDIETVINNYRLLLKESKQREIKLEKMVEELRDELEKKDGIIADLRKELTDARKTITRSRTPGTARAAA